jgi:hypothetical protein
MITPTLTAGIPLTYTLDLNRLTIPLPQPLVPGQEINLKLSYTLYLPAIPRSKTSAKPQVYGFTANQTNLVDWYPYLPPYKAGVGWLAHTPWYYGETLVYDVADFHLRLTRLDPLSKITLATSTPPKQVVGNTYIYDFPNSRSFALSAGPEYHVYSETVGAVTIYSYAFPLDTKAGEFALQNTVDAVRLYSELFGPYQHTTLSVVEADFMDGMEFDGLYFLSKGFYNLYDGSPKGYLTAIAVHETAHQWWYGQVGNDQALEPWLDESLCTYSELLFYENVYPDLVSWWWGFRINFYEPDGLLSGRVYDYYGYEDYRQAIYLRGAQFLDALRKTVGDDAFFAALKDYVAQYQGKIATTADFFNVISQYSSADLTTVKQEYFGP